jgi:hypothetical protein
MIKTDPTMQLKAEIDAMLNDARDNDKRTAVELYALQLDIFERLILLTIQNYLTSAKTTTQTTEVEEA